MALARIAEMWKEPRPKSVAVSFLCGLLTQCIMWCILTEPPCEAVRPGLSRRDHGGRAGNLAPL